MPKASFMNCFRTAAWEPWGMSSKGGPFQYSCNPLLWVWAMVKDAAQEVCHGSLEDAWVPDHLVRPKPDLKIPLEFFDITDK